MHGFPLDRNHWSISDWPRRLDEIRAVTSLPVWIAEVRVSSFGTEGVQEAGLRQTAELLRGRVERIHWYSLYDQPRAWPATPRHREAEGSADCRHLSMGLLREDGTPKNVGEYADFCAAMVRRYAAAGVTAPVLPPAGRRPPAQPAYV